MKNEYGEAVSRYEAALAFGAAIGDFVFQSNSLNGLAFMYQAQNQFEEACQYG